MKNKLTDLNNHLFAQLERLGDEDLTNNTKKLQNELDRTKAMTSIAKEIISNGQLVLDAQVKMTEGRANRNNMPALMNPENSK